MSSFQQGKREQEVFEFSKKKGRATANRLQKTGNGKAQIGSNASKIVFVNAEDEMEVRAWLNSESGISAAHNNTTPSEVVVSQWVFKKGVVCSFCPKEFCTVSKLVAHLERQHEIVVKSGSNSIRKSCKNDAGQLNGKTSSKTKDTGISMALAAVTKNVDSMELPPRSFYVPEEENSIKCPLAKCLETFSSTSSVNKHMKLDHKSIFFFSSDSKDEDANAEMINENSPKKKLKPEIISKTDTPTSTLDEQVGVTIPPSHDDSLRSANACSNCGSVFTRKWDLKRHIEGMKCDFKLKRNKEIKAFAEWQVEAGGGKVYECPICFYKHAERSHFGRHVFFNHPNTILEKRIENANIEYLRVFIRNKRKCSECERVFNRPVLLQEHLRKVHKINANTNAVVDGEMYSIKECKDLTNIENEKGENILPCGLKAAGMQRTVFPDVAPENTIEAHISPKGIVQEIPPDNCNTQTQEDKNNHSLDLPPIILDEENLNFFECGIDEIDISSEKMLIENVSENNLLGETKRLQSENEKLSLIPIEEVKESEDISQDNEIEDLEYNNCDAENEIPKVAGNCSNSLDDSDTEHPPPGFEEQEEIPLLKTATTFRKKNLKKRKTATDYSFIQPFKLGSSNKFQCPHCPQTVVGSNYFCRHVLLSHPETKLAEEVSAKKIKWLLGMERKKYKCNICGRVAACASNLSIHFKKVHKRSISVNEVIGNTDLLDPEGLVVFGKSCDSTDKAPSLQEGFLLLQDETAGVKEMLLPLSCDTAIPQINDEQIHKNSLPTEDKTTGNYASDEPLPQGFEAEKGTTGLEDSVYGAEEPMSICEDDETISSPLSPEIVCEHSVSKSFKTKRGGKESWKRKSIELLESAFCTENNNCPFCGKDRENFLNFRKHIAWHERREDKNTSKNEDKICPICEEILPPERNLNLHIFWHKRNGDVAYDSNLESEEEGAEV